MGLEYLSQHIGQCRVNQPGLSGGAAVPTAGGTAVSGIPARSGQGPGPKRPACYSCPDPGAVLAGLLLLSAPKDDS